MTSTDHLTYETRWDRSASTTRDALLAVDGSASEEVLRRTGAWAARQVVAALDLEPTDIVMELGCGVGRIGREIAPLCREWHGVDISSSMLRVAEQRLEHLENVSLHKIDRTSLDHFADASLDKIYCSAVLIHLDKEDVFLFLREFARVLRPGGVAYFETWNLADPAAWKHFLMNVEHWNASNQRERKDVSRNQFSVIEELRIYVEHAGLTEIAAYTRSPYIQMVTARDPDTGRLRQLQSQQERDGHKVRYSGRWCQLYSRVLNILAGEEDREQVIAELEASPDDPESRLFADYLRGHVA